MDGGDAPYGHRRAASPARRRACASCPAISPTRSLARTSDARTSSCSPTARSTSPASPFTALAFGKPLLLSDVGGFPELAAAGAAKTFPAGDVDALAEALRGLVDSPAALAGLAGARRARQRRPTRGRRSRAARWLSTSGCWPSAPGRARTPGPELAEVRSRLRPPRPPQSAPMVALEVVFWLCCRADRVDPGRATRRAGRPRPCPPRTREPQGRRASRLRCR